MSDHQTAFSELLRLEGRRKKRVNFAGRGQGWGSNLSVTTLFFFSAHDYCYSAFLWYGVCSLSLTCAGPQTLFFFFALQKENRTELMFPCIINNYMVGLSFPAVLCLNRLFCGASKLESLTTELKGFDYCFISPFSSLCLHLTAINYIKLWWRTRKKEKRW